MSASTNEMTSFMPSSAPLNTLSQAHQSLFAAKAQKKLSFDDIAKALGRDEVWVASAFYGQAKLSTEEIDKLAVLLGIEAGSLHNAIGSHWWPQRGAVGDGIPRDPVIYRLYEGVLVYGQPIKALIHEKFGDGIMSMIDCNVSVDKKADPKGDRVVLTFDGKFLSYSKW